MPEDDDNFTASTNAFDIYFTDTHRGTMKVEDGEDVWEEEADSDECIEPDSMDDISEN